MLHYNFYWRSSTEPTHLDPGGSSYGTDPSSAGQVEKVGRFFSTVKQLGQKRVTCCFFFPRSVEENLWLKKRICWYIHFFVKTFVGCLKMKEQHSIAEQRPWDVTTIWKGESTGTNLERSDSHPGGNIEGWLFFGTISEGRTPPEKRVTSISRHRGGWFGLIGV